MGSLHQTRPEADNYWPVLNRTSSCIHRKLSHRHWTGVVASRRRELVHGVRGLGIPMDEILCTCVVRVAPEQALFARKACNSRGRGVEKGVWGGVGSVFDKNKISFVPIRVLINVYVCTLGRCIPARVFCHFPCTYRLSRRRIASLMCITVKHGT